MAKILKNHRFIGSSSHLFPWSQSVVAHVCRSNLLRRANIAMEKSPPSYYYNVGPPFTIANLVNITPITMVFVGDISIVNGFITNL